MLLCSLLGLGTLLRVQSPLVSLQTTEAVRIFMLKFGNYIPAIVLFHPITFMALGLVPPGKL